ncbi:TetR/AcrR family transcriptional regulator [Solirubrobacter ginsenosidimutans]|uniref:TetR/AcrR family transcriptional regulator n=2 Tax=Solirubrobacter ginsenosidimutans TaxID=490573 RepID=A0A9X3MZ67_9ACTN|nr:TetR/AcrR family transcriptional regulator [Solirubrobacter ginsenosidimutans]MDA0164043.1 TetR/AcrR family transcriptional regulator [Solirubrobacter ginsenosidimutans]
MTDDGGRATKVRVMTGRLPRTPRSDAQDNRERILDAARAVFAADGLDAPMREIARQAGVGPATVYRHFPAKATLAYEVYLGEARACRAIVDEGIRDPNPWHGFCLVIEKVFELHAHNREFTAAFMAAFPDAMDFVADRRASLSSVAELARRAKAGGQLRHDFVLNDLVLMIMAHRGIRAGSPDARLAASRRFATLAIQAFRTL